MSTVRLTELMLGHYCATRHLALKQVAIPYKEEDSLIIEALQIEIGGV